MCSCATLRSTGLASPIQRRPAAKPWASMWRSPARTRERCLCSRSMGKERRSTASRFPHPFVSQRGSGDELYPGMCAPIPCVGINDAEATKDRLAIAGLRFTSLHGLMAGSRWKSRCADQRVPGTRPVWRKLSTPEASSEPWRFLSPAGDAPVHFKELSLFDLTQRSGWVGAECRQSSTFVR